jgi:hypothetical protein
MKYKDYSPLKKFFAKAFGFTLALFVVYAFVKYNIYRAKKGDEFVSRQEHSKHIEIDEIDGQRVWLIIYNGDTIGTVTTKK